MFSVSLNMSQMFEMAGMMVSAILPILAIPLGITLGVGLVGVIVRAFKGALSGF